MADAITIRRATVADVDVLVRFNAALGLETEDKRLDPAILRRGVERGLADEARAHYHVAEIDGEVVGQLMMTFEWSDWRDGWIWWFQSVYVHAEHRRQGVFRSLFQHVTQLAERDPDVVGLRLYVENANEVAQRTYRELGLADGGYQVMERFFGPA